MSLAEAAIMTLILMILHGFYEFIALYSGATSVARQDSMEYRRLFMPKPISITGFKP